MSTRVDKHGDRIFECDECGDVESSTEQSFTDCWHEVRALGWKFVDGKHYCDSCRENLDD